MRRTTEQPADLGFMLHKFFGYYLVQQRRLSHNTILAYRDTIKLYLLFLSERIKRPVALLTFNDIDRISVVDFLRNIEELRSNSARTRNNRLAAIKSFFNYVASEMPDIMLEASKILAIPQKKWDRALPGYLEREEIEALINAPDGGTWSGERDQVMLLLFTTLVQECLK